MTGPSVRGWLSERRHHRAKIRAAKRQADRERRVVEARLAGRDNERTT